MSISLLEAVPHVDVANRVMSTVRRISEPQHLEREIVWFGTFSVAAALSLPPKLLA